MQPVPLNKQKYLDLARTGGPSFALTQLQADTMEFEKACFEGEDGYRPDLLALLSDIRALSREIWDIPSEQG